MIVVEKINDQEFTVTVFFVIGDFHPAGTADPGFHKGIEKKSSNKMITEIPGADPVDIPGIFEIGKCRAGPVELGEIAHPEA